MTSVCAILVNYHDAAGTLAAATSILEEDVACSLHVIDNSTDEIEADCLATGLPDGTDLVVTERNIGFGAACNIAFRKCDSPYVLLLNPDARLLPGTLRQLHEALEKHPSLAAVAPATWWDEDRRWLLPTLLPETASQWLLSALASRWPLTLGRRLARRWLARQQQLHAGCGPQAVEFLSGAVVLLRRSAVLAAGGLFDERFFMFYEDANLSRRLRRAGYRLALVPEAYAVHHWRNKAAKGSLMTASVEEYVNCHYPRLSWLATHLGLHAGNPCEIVGRQADPSGQWGVASLLPKPVESPEALALALPGLRFVAVSPSPLGFPAAFRPLGCQADRVDASLWHRLEPGRHTLLAEGSHHWWAFEKASNCVAE